MDFDKFLDPAGSGSRRIRKYYVKFNRPAKNNIREEADKYKLNLTIFAQLVPPKKS
jgi:hypothetical protein